jgi:lipoprotein-anchoring transpeptidase ErfK/SrfK
MSPIAARLAALLAAGAGCVMVAPAQANSAHVPISQALVRLGTDHVVRAHPAPLAHRIEVVSSHRPLTGVRTVLPVIGRAVSRDGTRWAHVRLPGRPSGHKGWIRASGTTRSSTGWRIIIRLSARRVTVYRDGRVVRRFSAVVGKPSTPTPRGWFFVEESMNLSGQAGGPFALATSARSSVLQEFDGGPGQIAIHGVGGLFDPLGTAASHGCVRLGTPAITWLSRRIGAGVPLTIWR